MKLTRQAIEHAQYRLNSIVEKKIEKEVKQLKDAPFERPSLTYEKMYSLIVSGKAKLKPFADCDDSYSKLYQSYTYPEHDKAIKAYDLAKEKYNAQIDKIRSKHEEEKQKVVDRIMFSDSEAALQAIEQFSKD